MQIEERGIFTAGQQNYSLYFSCLPAREASAHLMLVFSELLLLEENTGQHRGRAYSAFPFLFLETLLQRIILFRAARSRMIKAQFGHTHKIKVLS